MKQADWSKSHGYKVEVVEVLGPVGDMKQTKIILLVLLVPYTCWILGQDRFWPRSQFAFLVLLSSLVPFACARLIRGKVRSTVAALVLSIIVLCLALYIPAKIMGESEF